jgi:Ca2+-transporting ATPase
VSSGTLARPADGGALETPHARASAEVLAEFGTSARGLTPAEAERRLAHDGPNALLVAAPVSVLSVLLDQFRSVVVLLLAVATLISASLGDWVEAAAIAAVLGTNCGLGFWIEWRAHSAMDALRRLEVHRARVLRDGRPMEVDARSLVRGDLLLLAAGEAVAADGRLLESSGLGVNEAPLTGESVPVDKDPSPVGPDAVIAERTCMVFKGTLVATGAGRAVVTATGRGTEIGRISELVRATESERTPLEARLDVLGRRLIGVTLGVAAVVAGLGLLRSQDPWLMLKTGLALAIAAVPEGLPVVATITLALGMRRMARRHALLRRLPAVETLGSATVVCADKTGTLTAGEMTAVAIRIAGAEIEVTGRGYTTEGELRRPGGEPVAVREVAGLERMLCVAALANHATIERNGARTEITGDPTEAALLVLADKAGLARSDLEQDYPRLGEVPFDSSRMWMASFHRVGEGHVEAWVKGAPRALLSLSATELTAGGERPLDDAARQRLYETNARLASAGLRVLAFGSRRLAREERLEPAAVRELVFLGFTGLLDPPAEGVKRTIERLRGAGIRPVMITGDQAATASAVAIDLGMLGPGDELLDGRALARMSADELNARVGRAVVYSRVQPSDKLRIVEALQRRGEIVAMLGDGVNDAPALKRADIGVAMGGRGTDVAKETADLVLLDDRLQTVGVAVEEGRVIFDNIRKFIFYLFSCNLAEVLTLFFAGVVGLPLPLLPLQLLWLNLVTDVFPALSLAVEPPEEDVMRRPPRDPASAILSRGFVGMIAGYGAVITAATLAAFATALSTAGARAGTIAFMTLALAQVWHTFNARRVGPWTSWRIALSNPWSWAAVALALALQLCAVYAPPLARVLGTVPPTPGDWGIILPASLAPLALGQSFKLLRARAPIA